MIKKIELRLAVAADLKSDRFTLNVGQPYLVSPDGGETVTGIYVLQGDEDVFVLKRYLETEKLFVPLNDFCFMNFIKDNHNELQQD
jgi:hypothetical protein